MFIKMIKTYSIDACKQCWSNDLLCSVVLTTLTSNNVYSLSSILGFPWQAEWSWQWQSYWLHAVPVHHLSNVVEILGQTKTNHDQVMILASWINFFRRIKSPWICWLLYPFWQKWPWETLVHYASCSNHSDLWLCAPQFEVNGFRFNNSGRSWCEWGYGTSQKSISTFLNISIVKGPWLSLSFFPLIELDVLIDTFKMVKEAVKLLLSVKE